MTSFDQLIRGLCALAGFTAPQRLLAGDAICFDNVDFAITVGVPHHPDALLLYADFGKLDLEKKAMLYPLMLKENAMMLQTRNCTFGVSEIHDSVVLIEKLSLTATTPESLLKAMRMIARKAHYFSQQPYRPSMTANRHNTHPAIASRSQRSRS